MRNSIIKAAIAAAAIAALPGAAQAGTATTTNAANFVVTSQCTVAGATVDLGTYTTTTTWGQVGAALGLRTTARGYTPGSMGYEYLEYGSVTCDAGAPYTLAIKGTQTGINAGSAVITVNGKMAGLEMGVKKLGSTTFGDTNGNMFGTGVQMMTGTVSAVGAGAQQKILGNMTVYAEDAMSAWNVSVNETLARPGRYTDTLTYTLNF